MVMCGARTPHCTGLVVQRVGVKGLKMDDVGVDDGVGVGVSIIGEEGVDVQNLS